jgi:hypothetical protein
MIGVTNYAGDDIGEMFAIGPECQFSSLIGFQQGALFQSVLIVPPTSTMYGPLTGMIIAGDNVGRLWVWNPTTRAATAYQILPQGTSILDLDVAPIELGPQNFYTINPLIGKLIAVEASLMNTPEFQGYVVITTSTMVSLK